MITIHFTEMGKTYKVHRNYDMDWMTLEEPCRCKGPASGLTIFSEEHPSVKAMEALAKYNNTMNGTILSQENIEWDKLRKSECEA